MLRVGVQAMKHVVDSALSKHKRVHVINEIGNHDDHTSVMLSLVLEAYYENNPRVTIDTSPDVFHWYEYQNNLIGVHHGHKCGPAVLYKVMAEQQREACGRCQHRYWYIGHVHHAVRQDIGGQVVESFRILAPRDSHHHGKGYSSPRDICSITIHPEHGECFRSTVNVEACR